MCKIGLITLDPKMYNYGGILQEYAMLHILQEYGDAEIVNYSPSNELTIFSAKRDIRNIEIKKIINYIKNKISRKNVIYEDKEIIKRRNKMFDDFRERYMIISDVVSQEELETCNYDVLVAGSDQIWNPDYAIPAFFLDFETNANKIIYAASIGKVDMTQRQRVIYGGYINRLKHVSIRERSGVDLLKDYTTTPLNIVVDPTLLISCAEWDIICSEREIKEKYIFCYFLELTEDKIKAVIDFSKKTNLKIVNIPYLHGVGDEFCINESIVPKNIGPDGFISLIKNADYIITDSFHATVFSCIYKKEFRVFGRNSGSYNMNTRIENLLELFGIQDGIIDPNELDGHFMNKYNEQCSIYEIIKESMLFLDKSILKK